MAQVFCFADEAGNFDFRPPNTGASKYFILTTVTMGECTVAQALVDLRHELAMEGADVSRPFHAAEDRQPIRDRVFEVLQQYPFRIDSTILEKSKAQPHLQASETRFYQMAWYLHFKYVGVRIVKPGDDILVIAAHLNTRKNRAAFATAVQDVVLQIVRAHNWRAASWESASDPCLWVADYCCWAIQRKWEREDTRSYDLIRGRIASEFDIWQVGKTRHY